MTIGELLLHMYKVCSVGKNMSTDVVVQEFLANYDKTRINIVHQHDLWIELKEALRVQIHAEVPLRINF